MPMLFNLISLHGPVEFGKVHPYLATVVKDTTAKILGDKIKRAGYKIVDDELTGSINKLFSQLTGAKAEVMPKPSDILAAKDETEIPKGTQFWLVIDRS